MKYMEKRSLSIREVQLVEYNILKKVVHLLKLNGIEYILAGGTMLGAVRHQGFIPWDDDIDILVPRKDYERLRKIISKTPNCVDDVVFRLPGDKDSLHPFIKAIDPKYICVDDRMINSVDQFVWIDIFPLDHFPDDENAHKKIVRKQIILKNILYSGILNQYYWKSKYQKASLGYLKHLVKFAIYYFMGGYTGVSRRMDRIAIRMNEKYVKSNHVGDGPWPEGMKDYFELDWTFPVMEHVFESDMFNIPMNYDAYLRHFYGDYMTPPPVEKRGGHSITVFKKDEM